MEKIFVFPSEKKKLEFDKNFNDGSYKFLYSKVSPDGTVTAYYNFSRKALKKNVTVSREKQLDLF